MQTEFEINPFAHKKYKSSRLGASVQSVVNDRDQRNKSCSSRDTGVAKDMPQPCSLHAVFICAIHGALHLNLKVLLGLASGSKRYKV